MTAHQVQLSESTVKYWEYSEKHQPTIVMVHGFRGDHHGLEYIARALPKFRVIIPDLPGFGASTAFSDRTHDIAGYATFLQEFISALKLPTPPVLLGHSFGSIVAAEYAAKYPQTIQKLILINAIAAPPLQGPKAVLSRLTSAYYWVGGALPDKAGRALLGNKQIILAMSMVLAKSRDKTIRAKVHRNHLAYFGSFANRRVVLEAFKASTSSFIGSKQAHQITVPTLLIAGELDDIAPVKQQKKLEASLPDARLMVVTGVGHLVHYEAPEKAAAAISEFING